MSPTCVLNMPFIDATKLCVQEVISYFQIYNESQVSTESFYATFVCDGSQYKIKSLCFLGPEVFCCGSTYDYAFNLNQRIIKL